MFFFFFFHFVFLFFLNFILFVLVCFDSHQFISNFLKKWCFFGDVFQMSWKSRAKINILTLQYFTQH